MQKESAFATIRDYHTCFANVQYEFTRQTVFGNLDIICTIQLYLSRAALQI